LLGGLFIPPRRTKDMVDFKIKNNIDKTKDNYIDNMVRVRTAKFYGEQKVYYHLN